jgi:hypothetical protein
MRMTEHERRGHEREGSSKKKWGARIWRMSMKKGIPRARIRREIRRMKRERSMR